MAAVLPASNIKRLVVEKAGEMRVSSGAVTVATGAVADYARRLGDRAASIARSHGRKTIMEEDIEAAANQV